MKDTLRFLFIVATWVCWFVAGYFFYNGDFSVTPCLIFSVGVIFFYNQLRLKAIPVKRY